MSTRQIVLDTETTGISAEKGHRIIEIGCVEMKNRVLTQERFHCYCNPERAIDPGAERVHGITAAFLADKPPFIDIVDTFLEFIQGAELIIHNAPFDMGFLQHEIQRVKHVADDFFEQHCRVIDTLVVARQRYPGQKNSLDALCRRLEVDNSHRELHGALLDAEILAEVYLRMTGGQVDLALSDAATVENNTTMGEVQKVTRVAGETLTLVKADNDELKAHQAHLEAIAKKAGREPIWDGD